MKHDRPKFCLAFFCAGGTNLEAESKPFASQPITVLRLSFANIVFFLIGVFAIPPFLLYEYMGDKGISKGRNFLQVLGKHLMKDCVYEGAYEGYWVGFIKSAYAQIFSGELSGQWDALGIDFDDQS